MVLDWRDKNTGGHLFKVIWNKLKGDLQGRSFTHSEVDAWNLLLWEVMEPIFENACTPCTETVSLNL